MTAQNFTVDNGLTITGTAGNITVQGGTGNAATVALGAPSGEAPYTTIRSYDGVSVTNNWTFTHAAIDPTEAYLYVPGGASITTPNATGGGAGKNIFIEAGAADQSDFYTTAGGELMLKGGRGAFNDGGGGGPGGNVNINAGESADPAGHAGNVYITAGALQNWIFDYSGNLTLPTNSFTVNYANGTAVSLGGNYSDSNVTTLLANLGANTISSTANITTTGNIAANNIGNISALNLNGNASQVLYGNGVFAAVAGGSSYGNADVAANLAAFGSNPISTTGNVTGGNINTASQITATGNITANTSLIRQGSVSQPAWTTSGIGLKMPAATYTDTTTAAGTLAASYIHAMAAPTLAFSNVVTVTNPATLFVASPTAGTNATIGNAYAIAASGTTSTSGNVLVGGNVYITGVGGSIRSLPGVAGAGTNGTYGLFDHDVPTNGYKYVQVGSGQTISTSNTQIYIGSQYGICNTTVYGNFVAANSTSLGNTATITTANYQIGYRDIPQIAFSANATAALTDAGKHYYSTTVGNLALTLPDNSNVAFATGTTLTVVVNAAGNVLVNQGTGVTLYMAGSSTTGNRVVGAYGLASVMKVAANTWVVSGTGVY